MAAWYVGFTCVECGSSIPVLRGEGPERAEIVDPLKVMCPACGVMKLYEPADAFCFRSGRVSGCLP